MLSRNRTSPSPHKQHLLYRLHITRELRAGLATKEPDEVPGGHKIDPAQWIDRRTINDCRSSHPSTQHSPLPRPARLARMDGPSTPTPSGRLPGFVHSLLKDTNPVRSAILTDQGASGHRPLSSSAAVAVASSSDSKSFRRSPCPDRLTEYPLPGSGVIRTASRRSWNERDNSNAR